MSSQEGKGILNTAIAGLSATAAFAIPSLCILWNLDVPTRLGVAYLTEQYLALILGLAVAVQFLTPSAKEPGWARAIDRVLGLLGLGTLAYVALTYAALLNEVAYRPPVLTFVGLVTVALVLEGVRRKAGWTLFLIVAIFLAYALLAHLVPGPLVGRKMNLVPLVQYIGFDPSAVYSTPLKVGAIVVVLFVFFGGLLFKAGGGAFFTDLALAATGRTRGGAAKISVVASALFGSISGSAVSNVATTGVITIPLMRRGGYSKTDAAAVEAIASTGGQLTPPIMGAAAFLMAEFLEIPYLDVVVAAIIPAALYYFSVYVQVDLIAARDRIAFVDEDVPKLADVLTRGWHFLLPFALLLYALFGMNWDPEDAALLSAAAIVAVGFVRSYGGQRLTPRGLVDVFVETGRTMVELILVVAAAGFVIGILNITGLGFALTLLLVDTVGGNLVLILMISAVVCIVLGMGMPTSGVYVLLAALVAPALVETGIEPLAAHLFILYFGMMSMITPPIALAAIAAAAIARAESMATGFASVRIGWMAFIVPFLFVGSTTLILRGDATAIALDAAKALLGTFAVSIAIVGYFVGSLNPIYRAAFLVAGAGVLPFRQGSEIWDNFNIAFGALAIGLLAYRIIAARARPAMAPVSSRQNTSTRK